MRIRGLQSKTAHVSGTTTRRTESGTHRCEDFGETNQQVGRCLYQDVNLVGYGTTIRGATVERRIVARWLVGQY
jgi:hypothetical protein